MIRLLTVSIALVAMSFASFAQSQDMMGFERESFGSVVLSRTQAAGTDVELELSIGNYENEPIINYSAGSVFAQIGRSVGRLDVLTDKGLFPCTAFIVSKKHILTNYHCSLGLLDNSKIGASRIDGTQFVAGYTQTGIEEGTKKYTVIPTPIETNKLLDYAVLEVLGDPSQEYGKLKLASITPSDGDPFWIIGHPMGEGQRISREKCKANDPALSAGKLLHTCDTLPGNSGSPVIDAGLQQVVALHHAGSQKDSVNFAILMSDILENSKILAAYKAPGMPPMIDDEQSVIAQNKTCDALYSAATQAKACYAYDVYIKSCSTHTLSAMARGYIEEFCNMAVAGKIPDSDDHSSNLPNCPEDSDYFNECYGTRDDVNLGKYVGEFQDNKYHGRGTLIDVSGSKYTGEWKSGERFGYGEELKISMSKRAGIGITAASEEVGVKVVSLIKDGPAITAGIKAGDLITHVNSKSVSGLTLQASVNMITGDAGTDITLTILRKPGPKITITLQRDIYVQQKIEYSGQWSNNKKNGLGVEKLNDVGIYDGQFDVGIYDGQFKDGKYHGIGEFKFVGNSTRAGETYYGEFKDGTYNGQGTYTFPDGTKYDGTMVDGKKNGQGTITYSSNNKYEGNWRDDAANGQGTFTYADGTKYVGGFKENKYSGLGTLTNKDGSKYIGQFRDGYKNGKGSYTFKDGSTYTGEFKDNLRHGSGEYIYAAGGKYDGTWKEGKRDGFGTQVEANGMKYTGNWIDGEMHGQGELKRPDGSVYTGSFKNDQRSGFGKFIFPGGSFEGNFENDAANGQGTYTQADGTVYKGTMKDGYQHGLGELNLVSGDKYIGEFEMGQVTGMGKSILANKNTYIGTHKNYKFVGIGIHIWKTGQTRFVNNTGDAPADGWKPNSTVHNVFPSLKKQFSEMAANKRKEIQSNLKREGLYASSIDGKWGRGTFTALVEFSSKNLATIDLRSESTSKRLLDAVLR